ncbi:NAD-binding protein [Vibrio penaeicida]|uniref:FAD-dependent oxidoreductase n=1 Tax=Vibrio penaeicida TaxID=104609 RepID=UPI002733D301|nr:FAD-dependent oxidoreductase [Vibrio penaeicida]MDP2574902.1 NAD-binding protein [Vibrio penaeicida]
MSNLCVVGGGLSGLEFALYAAVSGKRVHIYEAGPSLRQEHVHFDTRVLMGDEKLRPWTANNHWGQGGISERLGGRSLCYHGVMLPLEEAALASWPKSWQQILAGKNGLYPELTQGFSSQFPEMTPSNPVADFLTHVPQAARFMEDGRFTSYSPMHSLESFIRDGVITIERAKIAKVAKSNGQFYLTDTSGKTVNQTGFSKCVLAASAMVNTAIIASSLGQSFTSELTDHYCLGIAVKVKEGTEIGTYRHEMLWHGYSKHHDLNANIFVVERPRTPDGDRLLLLMAVVEQNPEDSPLSQLRCQVSGGKAELAIDAHHSECDIDNYNKVANRLVEFAREKLNVDLRALSPTEDEKQGKHFKSFADSSIQDEFDIALNSLDTTSQTNVFTRFTFPYGAYEHESACHPLAGKGVNALTEELELAAMPGLYAIGPGAFPRLGIANPALTICAMSRWLASHI